MQLLKLGEDSVHLTTKEADLLKLLCKNQDEILERNHALKAVWGDDNYFNGRSMDVYIAVYHFFSQIFSEIGTKIKSFQP